MVQFFMLQCKPYGRTFATEEKHSLAELDKHFVEAYECLTEVLEMCYIWNILKENICWDFFREIDAESFTIKCSRY